MPSTFRRYQLQRGQGLAGLQLCELDDTALPPLQPEQVRLGMRAAALNYRDLMIAGAGTPGEPAISPLSDGAGVVLEVGSAVQGWRPGDAVIANFYPQWIDGPLTEAKQQGALGNRGPGMLAERVVLPASALLAMPSTLSFAEAATLPCAGLVAWNALFVAGGARPGDTVLLLGTGGVSIWALQLAKAAGLRVLITSSSHAKLALARSLGADAGCNYLNTPDWAAWARAQTGGRGVDLVLETAGRATLGHSLAALRREGTLALVGGTSGWGGELDADAMIDGALRIVGVLVGSRAMAEDLVRFVEHSGLRPLIARRYAFEDAAQAYADLATAGQVGKLVIEIAPALTAASA